MDTTIIELKSIRRSEDTTNFVKAIYKELGLMYEKDYYISHHIKEVQRMINNSRHPWKLAFLKLEELFYTHQFHKEVRRDVSSHYEYTDNPIGHPLTTIDRGFRWVDCTTNLSSLEPKDVANLITRSE